MRTVRGASRVLVVLTTLLWSCQQAKQPEKQLNLHQYLQVLERIERAGNRYRQAIDLLKYGDSSLEQSLAESHLQLSRELLDNEFQLADVESKIIAATEPQKAKEGTKGPSAAEQTEYDNAVAEVWKLSADLDEARQRLASLRNDLKKATSAPSFRKTQELVEQAQQEVAIKDKKLDIAGSNLDIRDYQRKKSPVASSEAFTLSDRLKRMRDDLLAPTSKGPMPLATSPKQGEAPAPTQDEARSPGIVGGIKEFFLRRDKLQRLRRTQRETTTLEEQQRVQLAQRIADLESIQSEHAELNKKTEDAYSRAYELLKRTADKQSVDQVLREADEEMARSSQIDQQADLANRGIAITKRQLNLLKEDREKLASWSLEAGEAENRSLVHLGSRFAIVVAVIALILLASHYLKKLPYRFTHEGKNLYYFRKLISFTSGLLVAAIIILNFVGDFGGLSAVLGLAGAGLAIALQDPIVSLVGWFLIVGRFGISVGDRVEINSVKGDVIDIGLLRIAVLEIGNWVNAEQSTGRVVFFPNSFIFKNHYFNYNTSNSFIWDEIRITVTYESNWKKAREIIESVAERVSQEFVQEAKIHQQQMARQFNINLGTLTPYVYVSIAESGVDLLLRHLTEVRKRRVTQDEICREVLEAFSHETDIDLAYPTRRSVTETKVVSAVAEPGKE